jgi:hypothetical protein
MIIYCANHRKQAQKAEADEPNRKPGRAASFSRPTRAPTTPETTLCRNTSAENAVPSIANPPSHATDTWESSIVAVYRSPPVLPRRLPGQHPIRSTCGGFPRQWITTPTLGRDSQRHHGAKAEKRRARKATGQLSGAIRMGTGRSCLPITKSKQAGPRNRKAPYSLCQKACPRWNLGLRERQGYADYRISRGSYQPRSTGCIRKRRPPMSAVGGSILGLENPPDQ